MKDTLIKIETNLIKVHLATVSSPKTTEMLLESLMLIRKLKEELDGRSNDSVSQASKNT